MRGGLSRTSQRNRSAECSQRAFDLDLLYLAARQVPPDIRRRQPADAQADTHARPTFRAAISKAAHRNAKSASGLRSEAHGSKSGMARMGRSLRKSRDRETQLADCRGWR